MNLRPVILTERPSPHTPTCARPQTRISRNGGEPLFIALDANIENSDSLTISSVETRGMNNPG
jgi:hypothetical protein